MQVVSEYEWVKDAEYMPVAYLEMPIAAVLKNTKFIPEKWEGDALGLRLKSEGRQFIIQQNRDEPNEKFKNSTAILVPMIDATNTPRSRAQVENSFVAAMKVLGMRLPNVIWVHKDLDLERLSTRLGFGLSPTVERAAMDFRPIQP